MIKFKIIYVSLIFHLSLRSRRSTLQFSVMDASDGGTYSCWAHNKMGHSVKEYGLKVKSSLTLPPGAVNPVVTVMVKPNNASVAIGKPASLVCRVKSTLPPRLVE